MNINENIFYCLKLILLDNLYKFFLFVALTTSNSSTAKSSSLSFGPNMKFNFRSPSFLQKDIESDSSPFDGEYAFLPRDISREIEVPLAESKISKNLYADYIVKLKRLPIKDRFDLLFLLLNNYLFSLGKKLKNV